MSELFSEENLNQLNAVSPSFCLAKWLQVTIDLVNGTTHSCHHPVRHKIPLTELDRNPSALHNTNHKKQQRKMMLEGVRPAECSYCWDMEDLGNKYSDRYIKSNDPWAWSELHSIAKMPWDQNVVPRYLEVMIDNICNFSCSYCMSDISTGVAADLQKFGPYPITNPYHKPPQTKSEKDEKKIYTAAFEKWLPEIIHQLRVLRITGGEPLLSPLFWKLLDNLQKTQNENLTFIVNSHMNHNPFILDKFNQNINNLISSKLIKKFELYTSLDTHGAQAEYIRHGLDYDRVISNIRNFQTKFPDVKVVIMCTFNILSIGSFHKFIDDVVELKKQNPLLVLDVSYLRNPDYLRADILDEGLLEILRDIVTKIDKLPNYFNEHERSKFNNLLNWSQSASKQEIIKRRRIDLFKFINEYDKRKKKNFINIFPEYRKFIIGCKRCFFTEVGTAK